MIDKAWIVDDKHFAIKWRDGREDCFCLAVVQRFCPCVKCRQNKEKIFEKDVFAYSMKNVGCFGIKIHFRSGCSNGIYPLSLLRFLGKEGM